MTTADMRATRPLTYMLVCCRSKYQNHVNTNCRGPPWWHHILVSFRSQKVNLKWWDFYTTMHMPRGGGAVSLFRNCAYVCVYVCVTHEALYVGNG